MQFDSQNTELQVRIKYGTVAVICLFLIIFARLFYLQIVKGTYYHFFSTENSIKEDILFAPRGRILDRRGNVLVENRPAFDIVITPQYVLDKEKVFTTLSEITGLTLDDLGAIWKKRIFQPAYQPLIVKSDVTWDEMAAVRTRKSFWYDASLPWDLRGVDVVVRYRRYYPDGELASHILGYVREIDQKKLDEYSKKYPGRYRMGDMVGVTGLEDKWDLYLRGVDGYDEKVVDASGREVFYEGIADELVSRAPVPGDTMRITIDADLQRLAKEMFAGRKGAAVGVDVNTGAVRLLFSSPSYDLNRLASSEGSVYWRELAGDKDKPLLNRAVQGAYPPGSTYKIVTGIAALSEKVIDTESRITCHGGIYFGGRRYRCWNQYGHGSIKFHDAVARSCDTFFYRLGLKLGVDRIAEYAKKLGLGSTTGISLEGERAGLIPTSEWKQKRFGVPWQEGETLSISVGQGYDLVTPLQNSLLFAKIANGGYKLNVFLVEALFNTAGREIFSMEGGRMARVDVPQEVLANAISALTAVVAEPGGTAHRLSHYKLPMGGKTGTAQVVSLDRVCHGEECRDHAWFVGFAPANDPKIAVAVIVEHGGFGASAAAPIVGALLNRYGEIEGWIDGDEEGK